MSLVHNMLDIALYNVILLGLCFHFSSVAYITCYNSQKYVIDAIKKEDSSYTPNSSIGFCIVYGAFGIASIAASSIIKIFGTRRVLCIGILFNTVYIAQFLYPMTWMFYFGNLVAGLCGGLIWTAQGYFLSRNSDDTTISRNSGILWALVQSGNITGNIYMILTINKNDMNITDRNWLFGFLTSVMVISFFITLLFRKCVLENVEGTLNLKKSFIRGFKLFFTRDMLLLSAVFFYNGIELSFYSGMYSSSIGQIENFELKGTTRVSLSGILIGCGEATAGLLFGILGKKTIKNGRYQIIVSGCIIHTVTYFIIFINFPNGITKGRTTNEYTVIKSNLILALLCSFTLGFADACYVTQIYGLLGTIFAREGSTTFAIYRFVQCTGTVVAFGYASIGLYGILSFLIVVNVLATICFCIVELRPTYVPAEEESHENDSSL